MLPALSMLGLAGPQALSDVEAWWSELSPGCSVVLEFADDEEKHEMVVTWKSSTGLASVFTPDADHYVLKLSGAEADVESAVILSPLGELPAGIGSVYRFDGYPGERRLGELFVEGDLGQRGSDGSSWCRIRISLRVLVGAAAA